MIETKRLILKPLTYPQLLKYLKADNSLEAELHVNNSSRIITPELKEALEETILPSVKNPNKNHLYCTLWTIISKAENKMVGDLCITGEPNAAGEIEIGYGTYKEFEGNGFMTEAVGGIINWAKSQPDVKCIVAGTEKSNIASFAILLKNNFEKTDETETLFLWRLALNGNQNR